MAVVEALWGSWSTCRWISSLTFAKASTNRFVASFPTFGMGSTSKLVARFSLVSINVDSKARHFLAGMKAKNQDRKCQLSLVRILIFIQTVNIHISGAYNFTKDQFRFNTRSSFLTLQYLVEVKQVTFTKLLTTTGPSGMVAHYWANLCIIILYASAYWRSPSLRIVRQM